MTNIVLKEIGLCSIEQKKTIRLLRNQEYVKKFMYNDHKISTNEHISWLEKLKTDVSRQVFLVLEGDINVLGLVSLDQIDSTKKEATWAFYLEQKVKGGLGPALEYFLIDYAFNHMNLDKLKCQVLDNNLNVLKLHSKFLFIVDKFLEMQFHRNDEWLGIYFLSLNKKIWKKKRKNIYIKYRKIFEKFDINLSI